MVVRELEVTGLHGKDLLQCPYAVKAKRNARNSPRRGQFLTKPPTRNKECPELGLYSEVTWQVNLGPPLGLRVD